MTRSSIVAAVVVTLLLGLLIWWRDEHPRVARVTAALTPPSDTIPRTGKVTVVPAARIAPPRSSSTPAASTPGPYGAPSIESGPEQRGGNDGVLVLPGDGTTDAGRPTSR